jgi:septal ring factor EnvC (AmiA/AmiB activator)
MAKLQEKINDLKKSQEGFDRDVARLMEEDEAIEKDIADIERKIEENDSSIVNLKSRLAVISEARKTSKGTPAVKIGGNMHRRYENHRT